MWSKNSKHLNIQAIMILIIKNYKKSEKGGEMDYSYRGFELEIEDSSNGFSHTYNN